MANWISSTQVRQKEILTVYCFTCACVFNDCPIQRRKSNYQRQLSGVTLHMGCNYSVKEHWLNSDRQWLRDLITRELAAKITSRKKVWGGKTAFRLGCIFVNPQLAILANCCARRFVLGWTCAALRVPQTLVGWLAHPWSDPGARGQREARPSAGTWVSASYPALGLLKCGAARLLILLSGQRCVCWRGRERLWCWQFSQPSPVPPASVPLPAGSTLHLRRSELRCYRASCLSLGT